jgi:hypothetical protein
MYIPSHYSESDVATLHQYIRTYNFGLLILADDKGIEANHVPFHLVAGESGTPGHLQCHLSRSNPAWQAQSEPEPARAEPRGCEVRAGECRGYTRRGLRQTDALGSGAKPDKQ